MRQNFIVALLSICLTLLAVNLLLTLRPHEMPVAFGQAVGTPTGTVAIAAVQSQGSDPWCFVYEVATQRLACYTASRTQGVEFKGVRQIAYDLKAFDLASQGKTLKVRDIKKEIERQASGDDEKK